jgi:nicotinamidase-related amidase
MMSPKLLFNPAVDVAELLDQTGCREITMKQIHGLDIPTNLDDVCDPRRMALLVYDMQQGICSQIKKGNQVTRRIGQVLSVVRSTNMRVVFTWHLSLPKAWMGVSQFRTAMAWQRKEEPGSVAPWFLRDASSFQLVPELSPTPDEAVFDKITMSAFEGTPLAFLLRDCGILSVAIVGIAIEIGIEPTARHAADLGFIPVIIADACGTGDDIAAERSLDSLRFAGDTIISNVETFTGLLERGLGTARTGRSP